jgi:hypothetical protein
MPPPQQSVELFNADGTMARVDTKSDKYIMEILIPDISEIESVHLFLEKPGLIPKSARVKKASALEPIAIFHVREIEFA